MAGPGGLVVGVGGLIQPRALGVGYDIIGKLLQGDYVPTAPVGLIVVKAVIWSMALGSGTSGGVLAPLLIMGCALGAMISRFLPGGDAALWPPCLHVRGAGRHDAISADRCHLRPRADK